MRLAGRLNRKFGEKSAERRVSPTAEFNLFGGN